jgi:hypothetical protein
VRLERDKHAVKKGGECLKAQSDLLPKSHRQIRHDTRELDFYAADCLQILRELILCSLLERDGMGAKCTRTAQTRHFGTDQMTYPFQVAEKCRLVWMFFCERSY